MKKIKTLAAALTLGVAMTAGALAQQPASSIGELLNRVRSDVRETSQENQERLSEFQANTNRQQALLQNARNELAALERQKDQLEAQYEANQIRNDELDVELRERQGSFRELFGQARQSAGEFAALIDSSIVSSQFPGRADALEDLADSRTLPTRMELDQLWRLMIEEMIYQGQVVTFQARVNGLADGQEVDATRVGPFAVFSSYNGNQRFARFAQDETTGVWALQDMATQPPANFVAGASNLYNAEPNEIVRGTIDPSRGGLLEIYKDVPDLGQRIEQGGLVGYIILGLLAISVVFGLFRLFSLVTTQMAVSSQKRSSKAKKGNPLGRVMLAYEAAKDKGVETVELKLDEAILQETPKLEFGLNFLKLGAGIAPLLGLLGTVTGMIKTFTMITIFGAGDPQVMAGGISEALMTTVLGLVASIPLLFIHSFAASFARGVQQVLEEQAAGIVARHSEEQQS